MGIKFKICFFFSYMSLISVKKVTIKNNPATFLEPLTLEVEFECIYDISEDLEWKLIYVGSSNKQKYDQELERFYVGPLNKGIYRFDFVADPPQANLIPRDELVGASVILLTCSYKYQEFIKIGYFVNVDFLDDTERDRYNNSNDYIPNLRLLDRHILSDQPRITKYNIDFKKFHL